MQGLEELSLSELPDDAVIVPATSAQRGLWITQLLDVASTAYHIGHAFEIRGPLDRSALDAAFASLFARHEVLRTGFVELETGLSQVIHAALSVALPVTELPAYDRAHLPEPVLGELDRPFDLTQPPLFRAHLFTVSIEHHILVLVAHHLILDAQSVDLLWTELASSYALACQSLPFEESGRELQFADYAEWESRYLTAAEYRDDLAFFREQLAGIPKAIDFPLVPRSIPA